MGYFARLAFNCAFQDDMNEQFIVYNGIIREREEKEFEEYRERYENFVKNRSAKIIQRWWRKLRLKLKKKNKKKVCIYEKQRYNSTRYKYYILSKF